MKIFLTIIVLFSSFFVFSQKGRIEGKVFDKTNKQPVAFANVVVVGTSTGSVTDIDGKFIITGLNPGFANLKVSFVGYKTEISNDIQVTNSNAAYMEVFLEPVQTQLETVEIKANPFDKRDDALVSVQKIGIKEIETNPGSNRDISRVIQSFPGVSSTPNFRNDVIVRGGGPSESRFYLDDVEIPVLNHFSTQGASGGPVGIINADFISSVNYYSGSFPSNRSNALSGVFEFTQKDGNNKKTALQAALGASETSLTLDGPLGKNSNYIFSVRRSYLQFLFSAIGLPFLPTFNDYQFKAKFDLNKKNQITIISLGALDNMTLNTGIENPEPYQEYILSQLPVNNQWSYVFGVVYKNFFKNGFHTMVFSRNMLDNSFYKYPENDETQARIFDYNSREAENKLRYELSLKKNGYSLRASLNGEFAKYSNSTNQMVFSNDTSFLFSYQSALEMAKFGGSVQVSKKVLKEKLTLSLGARVDGNNYNSKMQNPFNQVSPRFSASYEFGKNFRANFGVGRYFQLPAYTTLGYKDELGQLANSNAEYIGANHVNLGIEKTIGAKMLVSVEAFYKDYFQYPIDIITGASLANSGAAYSSVAGATEITSSGSGRAVGAEMLYRLKLEKFNMIASYTFVRSSFTNIQDELIPSSWDSRHLLTLTGTKEFKKNWSAGFKWRVSGGLPYTPYDLQNSAYTYVWDVSGGPVYDFDKLNSERFSPFHQLDLRVDKKFFFDKFSLMLYFDIQNAYNFKSESQDYIVREKNADGSFVLSDNGTKYVLQSIVNESGTVLPTLGLMIKL